MKTCANNSKPKNDLLLFVLSVGQLVCWGSLVYSFPVISIPMCKELSCSESQALGLISAALFSMGIFSSLNGKLFRKFGPRILISSSAFMASILLMAWSSAGKYWELLIIWIGIGSLMAALLFENTFNILHSTYGAAAGRGIATVTTVSAFASSVYMPATLKLIESFGWRHAAIFCAATMSVYALFSYLAYPLSVVNKTAEKGSKITENEVASVAYKVRLLVWILALSFGFHALVTSALWMYLIRFLEAKSVSATLVSLITAAIGPSQVIARLVQVRASRVSGFRALAPIAFGCLPIAGLLLYWGTGEFVWPLLAFAALFGIINGLIVIARGLVPIELFEDQIYPFVNGRIGAAVAYGRAAGPYIAGTLAAVLSNSSLILSLVGFSLLAATLFISSNILETTANGKPQD